MRYKVRLKESEEGYAMWCPSLPGCWSQGETKEEAIENIKDAIKTDEDIPIYNETGEKLFWISVKTVSGYIKDPIRQMPSNYQGWMCGEVESKQ